MPTTKSCDSPKKKCSPIVNIIKCVAACLFIGYVVAIVIPTFLRASLSKASNACINNLRLIQSAKEQWALEQRKVGSDTPAFSDLQPYFGYGPMGEFPKCPSGGKYTVGRVDEDPTCSIGTSAWPNDHVLPGTNDTDSWWVDFKAAYSTLLGLRSRSASP
jgi:hypothetical protein